MELNRIWVRKVIRSDKVQRRLDAVFSGPNKRDDTVLVVFASCGDGLEEDALQLVQLVEMRLCTARWLVNRLVIKSDGRINPGKDHTHFESQ